MKGVNLSQWGVSHIITSIQTSPVLVCGDFLTQRHQDQLTKTGEIICTGFQSQPVTMNPTTKTATQSNIKNLWTYTRVCMYKICSVVPARTVSMLNNWKRYIHTNRIHAVRGLAIWGPSTTKISRHNISRSQAEISAYYYTFTSIWFSTTATNYNQALPKCQIFSFRSWPVKKASIKERHNTKTATNCRGNMAQPNEILKCTELILSLT